MKLTIIVEDSTVYKDGVSKEVDIVSASIPVNVHAVQWKDTQGWIEYKDLDNGVKPQNEVITELPAWAISCVTLFDTPAPVEIPV